jgi:hypothetical protein
MPLADECLQAVKDRRFNGIPMLEMLYHDALQQLRRHPRIPDAFGIYDDDWSGSTHTQTRRLTTLYSLRPEEKIFALQELGEQRINLPATPVGRTKIASADEHVARVGLHLWLRLRTHSGKIQLAPHGLPFAHAHLF